MKLLALFALLSPVLSLAAVVSTSHSDATSKLAVEITSTKGPIVHSVDDLILVSTVTNHGEHPIKVVKYGGIVDDRQTESFIVRRGDQDIRFTGIHLLLTYDDEALYTSIAPGQSITTQHRVASSYDFQSVGAGEFTFIPIVRLSPGEHIEPLDASSTITVTVTDNVSTPQLEKRAAVSACTTNTTRQEILTAAYHESKMLAAEASRHVTFNPTGPLFTSYFKNNVPTTVSTIFTGVADEYVNARLISCADPFLMCRDNEVVAYTDVVTSNSYFCPKFFDQLPPHRLCSGSPVHEKNIRAAIVLHELTLVTSCSGARALSAPEQLVNGDNYNCFATEVYVRNNCP
ncbi:hypothetical protein BDV98DRAFT_510449 [Pterulicium gracile]|uniref:deuterolysin n=1 Tax=Pterulicium gracile TaxID=1884261 RepID=A0A5C3QBX6_9AGAR|nr:hypothetical protein BDV98DRAFT_510449 [Pterula gracilis]